MRRLMMKRMDITSGAGMFGSRSSMFNRSNDNVSSSKYYCMSCVALHKEAAYSRCGSKIKKVGF
jgi:hypothetical protein